MEERTSLIKNSAFFIVCILVVMTPMLRGSVHLWAETLIQMLALTGVTILVLEIKLLNVVRGRAESGKKIFLLVVLPLVLLAVLSALFARSRDLAFEGVLMLLTLLAIFFVTHQAVRSRKERRVLVYVIISTGLFLAFFGMLKRYDMNFLGLWEYSDHLRPTSISLNGPYVNRNHMAGFLEMVIPVMLGLFLTREHSNEKLLGMICLTLFFIVAQAMTLSRGGWSATLGALAFMMLALLLQKEFKQKRLLVSIVVSVLIVGLIILASTPVVQRITTLTQQSALDTLGGRDRMWEGTLSLIKDHLYTGTGPGTFTEAYPAYQEPGASYLAVYAHNDYLQFLADCGIPALFVMAWLLFLFFRAGFKKLQSRSRQTRGLTLGAMGAVVAILIHSFSDFNLHIPANAVLFTVLSATVFADDGV